MALDRIKELLDFMKEHGLAELELEEKGFRVRLVKNGGGNSAGPATVVVSGGHAATVVPAAAPAALAGKPEAAVPDNLVEITSPIVGTLYRASGPDAESFVELGSHVEPDTTMCIIEAMKVMNEVKAEMTGVVRKVLLENGQPVEYGQPIFLIEPIGA